MDLLDNKISICVCLLSCVPVGCSLWAPLSLGYSRQEQWSRLPFLPPGDFPDHGLKPTSPAFSCLGNWILYC